LSIQAARGGAVPIVVAQFKRNALAVNRRFVTANVSRRQREAEMSEVKTESDYLEAVSELS